MNKIYAAFVALMLIQVSTGMQKAKVLQEEEVLEVLCMLNDQDKEENCHTIQKENEYWQCLSAKLAKAIRNGDLVSIAKLMRLKVNPCRATKEGAVPLEIAQWYFPKDELSPTKEEIMNLLKPNLPSDIKCAEITIDSDDEGW
jgi:hypothetical protein